MGPSEVIFGIDMIDQYVDALYFMTQTISTVGYGDSTIYSTEGSEFMMIYMCFVIFSGMLLFALVTNEIFNARKVKSLQQLVKEKVYETEVLLYELSGKIKHKSIPKNLIEEIKGNIRLWVSSSTHFHFAENKFFNNLSPALRFKLVENVLFNEKKKFKYFFEDYEAKHNAPVNF